jgi:hypothetical protein
MAVQMISKKLFPNTMSNFNEFPQKEHRINVVERAIRTFKNHLIANLCTIDSHFPLTDWDRLLPQTTLTLNLLRSSRIHPSLSAHASLFGQFNFNRTPIAPTGRLYLPWSGYVSFYRRGEGCMALTTTFPAFLA